VVVLLLRLALLAVAPELRRSAQLSHEWRVDHAVHRWSTARTTSDGSWHGPLPLIFLNHFTSVHSPLLINGSAG
jgi:hypothetical protein